MTRLPRALCQNLLLYKEIYLTMLVLLMFFKLVELKGHIGDETDIYK